MGQDQSQTIPEKHLEKAASPDAERRVHHKSNEREWEPQKVRDGSEIVSPPQGAEIATARCQGGNNDLMREEAKSQSVWYDSEQLEQDMSKEKDLSSPQLFEQGVSSCQLSPTLSQPHAAGIKPDVSHGSASQRQEVHGSLRDEEAGPDWKKAGREEVTTHSKKSSENEEEDERQGYGEKEAKSRKKKRKKRGKRGGIEHKKLSSSSSIESQSHIEIQTQVTDHNIPASKDTDITGRADIPAPSTSVPGKTDEDAMHLPNQAESKGETRDGTNLNFETLNSGLTELSEASDLNVLGELSEVKNTTFHQSTEVVQDITAAQSEEMDLRTTEKVEIPESPIEKKEMFDGQDNIVSVSEDCIGEVSEDQPDVESNSSPALPATHPDLKQFNADFFLEQETELVQSVDMPLQLGRPSGNGPEIVEPVGSYGSPIDGTTDVPPLQTREGSTEITAVGQLGHCLEMLGHKALKEENKDELWKEEECEIGSLPRCEEIELCSNHVAETEEGPFIEDELELTATAVAVVTVAVAMARLEISQQLAESCTKRPAINLSTQQGTDEMPAPFNLASDSVSANPFTQDINKDQPHFDSPTAQTENPPSHTELNIAFEQESFTDSNAVGNQPDASYQTQVQSSSNEQTEHDLSAEQDDLCLRQTKSADDRADSNNQDLVVLSSNEQTKLELSAEEHNLSLFKKKFTGLLSSDTNLQTNEVLGKIPDPCPVLDTGQEGSDMFDPKNKPRLKETTTEEGSKTQILVEGSPLNDEGEMGNLTEERGTPSKESCNTSLTNINKSETVQLTEEQTPPLSCEPVSPVTPCESALCSEENIFVELDTGIQSCQQLLPDAEAAVVMEIKGDALECLDQDSGNVDTVDGWREKEKLKREDGEQAKTSQSGK